MAQGMNILWVQPPAEECEGLGSLEPLHAPQAGNSIWGCRVSGPQAGFHSA